MTPPYEHGSTAWVGACGKRVLLRSTPPTAISWRAGSAERMALALRGDRPQEDTMGKTGRKRRGRKKKAANHGKRPNA